MELMHKARLLARRAHEGQLRKYSDYAHVPYIVHPERVAEAAIRFQMPETAVAAAYLHDVIEDCDAKFRDEIAQTCGTAVYLLVHELTDPSKGMKAPRALRKRIDREHLRGVSFSAVCIKLFDRIDNIKDMHEAPADFKKLYCGESRELLDELRQLGPEKYCDELASTIYELEETCKTI